MKNNKWFFRILSHLCAFIYGAYVYGTINGGREVKPHQWLLTGFFGIFFLLQSLPDKKES